MVISIIWAYFYHQFSDRVIEMKKSLLAIQFIILILGISLALPVVAQEEPPPTEVQADKISQGDKEFSSSEVERLKETVLDEKLQLRLLRHLTKKDGIAGGTTKILISFLSEMSSRYQIYSLVYKLDGETVYSFFYGDTVRKADTDKKPREYSQPLAPGTHSLEIQAVHTGNDTGVFSYLNDYKILTEKKFSFEVRKENSTKIDLIAYEKGWILTDFKERPDLRIKIDGSFLP